MDLKRNATLNLVGAFVMIAFTDSPAPMEAPSRYDTRTAWTGPCAEESVVPFKVTTGEVKHEDGSIEKLAAISFEKTETIFNPGTGHGCRVRAIVMPSFQVEAWGEEFFANDIGDANLTHQAAMAIQGDRRDRLEQFKRDWDLI